MRAARADSCTISKSLNWKAFAIRLVSCGLCGLLQRRVAQPARSLVVEISREWKRYSASEEERVEVDFQSSNFFWGEKVRAGKDL
jgi:hypothetical protein